MDRHVAGRWMLGAGVALLVGVGAVAAVMSIPGAPVMLIPGAPAAVMLIPGAPAVVSTLVSKDGMPEARLAEAGRGVVLLQGMLGEATLRAVERRARAAGPGGADRIRRRLPGPGAGACRGADPGERHTRGQRWCAVQLGLRDPAGGDAARAEANRGRRVAARERLLSGSGRPPERGRAGADGQGGAHAVSALVQVLARCPTRPLLREAGIAMTWDEVRLVERDPAQGCEPFAHRTKAWHRAAKLTLSLAQRN